jgi:AraC-like DNA-binding protein
MQDSPVDIVQLEGGEMSGTLKHMSLDRVGVSTSDFTRGFRSLGSLSDHRMVLGTVLDGPATIQHIDMAPGEILILKPNHELYTQFFRANTYATVLIEQNELCEYAEQQQPGAADAAIWRQSAAVMATDPAMAAARAWKFRTLLTVLTEHGATMSPEVAEFYKRSLLELVAAPVLYDVDYRIPSERSALKLVRDVDRFLIEAGPRPVHISELSAKFGRSARSLQRAFYEVLGMSPRKFHQLKRLGDAYNSLLMAVPGDSVTTIAIKHGFPHQGRFAEEYYLQFGELPSETLRRSTSFRRSRLIDR